ncbi:MAG TPA: 3-isopropylmalate dehydratase small subunit [Xanthomonadales bacterium]|nr:3-isopropylmalate dehydratase small subunit [Xanthomonadales bacterium]
MRAFTRHTGIAAPLLRSNIDTDAIIPSVEMKTVGKKGLASGLFAGWRYADRETRALNPEFILNQPEFAGTSILLAGQNFGCGSSREHAVWALDEFGIRVIIAPSFGAIFRNNCIANGLLPVTLPWPLVSAIADEIEASHSDHELLVDLEKQEVVTPSGTAHGFKITASEAERLLKGLDAISLTMQLHDQMEAFHRKDCVRRPWVYLPHSH